MKTLPQNYDHTETEARWQKQWAESGVYTWRDDKPRDQTFVIDTPPPTVSGTLHMGHIFSYTQADFVARYQRMAGKDVFYPMGFDDNGLPTERLVEKVKKIRATDMSREDFIKECEAVSDEARVEFRNLFTSVALSVDWQQEYHTISEHCRTISQLSFLDLFHKNEAYRKLQPMLWDPVDQTAIAQAEVEDKDMPSFFCDIEFGIEGSDEKLIIATTRPELIPACVAIFYHPDDARYQPLKGKFAITPLFGVRVPILEDDTVEIEKGTGIMMCCTFGDEADIAKWKKHNLETRIILNKYGKLDLSGEWLAVSREQSEEHLTAHRSLLTALQGKKTSNTDPKNLGAREIITQLLDEAGLLKEKKPITHAVKCAERSGAPLEFLPTHQWFIKVTDKKSALKEKVAECNWYPNHMKIRADQWIDGLNWDWCISRQRYFGVPFPIWYSKRVGEEGKILVASTDQLPVNPLVDLPAGYTRDEVEPDMDVMDTWATSSVSPQINSHGINPTSHLSPPTSGAAQRHAKLFPADLRPQAHEIIRTWAFYTIAKAHLHQNSIPWRNLMISGWCLASDKTKMSKSKGNIVTPVGLIEEKSADVVRYWASTSRLGADTAYSEDVLKIGRKLVNKLWNATKFAAIQLERGENLTAHRSPLIAVENGVITAALDLWILTRLHRAIAKATAEFEKFEYCIAREAIEDFFWNDFCDNYLEMVKVRAYGGGEQLAVSSEKEQLKAQQSAIHTIYHCLNGILRLFAPFVPHVTEELYQAIFRDGRWEMGDEKSSDPTSHLSSLTSIHARGTWPSASDYPLDKAAEKTGIAAVEILNVVRKVKAEKNVSIKWPIDQLCIGGGTEVGIAHALADLAAVTSARNIAYDAGTQGEATANGEYQVLVVLAAESDAA